MPLIDLIVVGLVVWALYRGYKKGLLLELTGFLALIPAFWVAANFSRAGAKFLQPYIGKGIFLPLLAFLLVFAVVFFGTRYLVKVVRGLIRVTLFGQADRFAGAAFSFARIFLITALLLYTAKSFGLLRMSPSYCGAVCELTTDAGARMVRYLSAFLFS